MTLQEIKGQEKISKQLSRLISSGRLSHAYLFLGPKGSLKTKLAMAFAAAILSLPSLNKTTNKDFEKESLHLFEKGNHPDFHIILPEGNQIKIKQIRDLKDKLAQYEKYSSHTVVLIKEADLMGLEASNAFLKTLEEPLGQTIFILLATSREKLLDTIFSRVQTLYFPPLSKAALSYYASTHTQFTSKSPLEKKLFLSLAFGSKDKLFDLLENEQSLFKTRDELFELLSILHEISYGKLALFVEKLSNASKEAYKNLKSENKALTERQYQKDKLKQVFFLIESFYQDLFTLRHLTKEACYHSDKIALYERVPDFEKHYKSIVKAIYEAYERLEYNTDYSLVFLVLLISIKNKLN